MAAPNERLYRSLGLNMEPIASSSPEEVVMGDPNFIQPPSDPTPDPLPQVPPPRVPPPAPSAGDEAVARLADLLATGMRQSRSHVHLPSMPQCFHGNEHESPRHFIFRLEQLFFKHNVNDTADRLYIAYNHLKGDAKKWYEPFFQFDISYVNFKDRFLRRFDNISCIAVSRARLYGEKQKDTESVALFVTRKQNLFIRCEGREPDQLAIDIFIDQLRPEIKSRLRSAYFLDINTLIHVASQVEADLEAIPKRKEIPRYSTTTFQPRGAIPRNQNFREIPPVSSYSNIRPNNVTSNPNVQNSNVNINSRANPPASASREPGGNQRPPSPCHHCGAWHYNRNCPRNPYVNQVSGNVQGPELTRTTETAGRDPSVPLRNQPVSHDHQRA